MAETNPLIPCRFTNKIPSGIGKELLSTLLQRPNTTVVGGVRNPASAVSQALTQIPAAEGSRFILVQIDSTSETDAKDAVELLKSKHNIQALDVVIANAGVGKDYGPIAEKSISDMREHFEVNTIGTLILFQAVLPLLEAAQAPKFVPISSIVGSISELEKTNFLTVAYGTSKAALNYVTKKIHLEYPNIIAFPMHPGYVQQVVSINGASH